jgi:hypothetical protein
LVDDGGEDETEVFFHSFLHGRRFNGLLVELKVAAEIHDRHVLNAEDLVLVVGVVDAGISIKVLLFLDVIKLLNYVFLEFLDV